MGLQTTKEWNQFFVRFLIAFAFWEVVALPIRMFFFSPYYHNPNLSSLFQPLSEVMWIGPIFAELFSVFFVGLLFTLVRSSLPEGILGGLLFGITFILGAYVFPVIFASNLTTVAPVGLWWTWVLYLSLQVFVVSIVHSI